MLNRSSISICVSLLLLTCLAVGFPLGSKTAGRRQPAPLRQSQPDPGASAPRPFSGMPAKRRKLTLNVARRNHTATTLADGRVLIIGGDNLDGVVREAALLDPAAATLTLAAKSLSARTKHAATLLADGRVLVTGGSDQAGLLDSTEIFDPQTGPFSAGPQLQRARAGHSATLLANGLVLIAGGKAEESAAIFDPASGRAALLNAKLTTARGSHSALLLGDGNVLLVGGEARGHGIR